MTYPRSVLRQYWAGERPRLWRIGRWMLGIALILTPFAFFFQTPRTVIALLMVAMIVIVIGRRLLAGRDMHAVLLRRWQREMSLHVQAAWPSLAHTLRLQIRTLDGRTIFAGLGIPRWERMTLVASVRLPQADRSRACRRNLKQIAGNRQNPSTSARSARFVSLCFLNA